jgi:hypothetical protein
LSPRSGVYERFRNPTRVTVEHEADGLGEDSRGGAKPRDFVLEAGRCRTRPTVGSHGAVGGGSRVGHGVQAAAKKAREDPYGEALL